MKKTMTTAAAFAMMTAAANAGDPPEWTQPIKPFHIAGNIYYVGMKGIAAYLIVGDNGAVLIDGTLKPNARQIEKNIEALGFKLADVKILLNSHAHFDHAAGLARIKKDTGAELYASEGDQYGLEHGAQVGDITYKPGPFPPVKVDHVLKPTDQVKLGNIALDATVTPGHTRGCTTWATTIEDGGKSLRVVFPCGFTVAGNVLVGNKGYPGIAEDFAHSFDLYAGMKADIVLTGHPEQSDLMARKARADAGDKNAYVDPGMLGRLTAKYRADFEAALEKARSAAGKG